MSGVRTNKRAHKARGDMRSAIGSEVEFGVREMKSISKQGSKHGPEQFSEQPPEPSPGQDPKQRQFEEQVESRVKALGSLVDELTAAPYVGSLMRERDSVRETLVELVVKEEALREIVQMAKHSGKGAARKMLWRDIEGAVADLEKKSEGFAKAACA